MQPPHLTHEISLQVRNLPINQVGQFYIGFSNTNWNSSKLPLDLSFMGAPGCALLVAPFLALPVWTAGGTWALKVKIPPNYSLLAGEFYTQCWAMDPKANAAGIAVSDAGKGVVGS